MNVRPAEWQKNLYAKVILFAWPYDETLWQDNLLSAQAEFIALINALGSQKILIFFPNEAEKTKFLLKAKPLANVQTKVLAFGDIWLRDTAPIFINPSVAVIPTFNGWGNKYLFDDDKDLASRIASCLSIKNITNTSLVFEGGSLDFDGQGSILTTNQCLLNKNRNPHLSKSQIENELLKIFSAKKVIWVNQGLINDHTDGHIDTIARFVAPGKIAIMESLDKDDPNKAILQEIQNDLKNQTDALNQPLEFIKIPSPGKIVDEEGNILPASYLNFIIADDVVIVPTYGSQYDTMAIEAFKKVFGSNRAVVGLSALSILTGGGAFHCISQEYFV